MSVSQRESVTRIIITPSMAEEFLKKNTRNRPLSEKRSDMLASAMSRGEWAYNGDTICIASDGVILDGQHRLAAIVKSGIALDALIVKGLAPEVFDTKDIGNKRSCSHTLAVRGIKNYTVVSSGLSLLFAFTKTGNPYHGAPDSKPTIRQAEELLQANIALIEAASTVSGMAWSKRFITPSITVFCIFTFNQKNKKKCADFFDELETGSYSYPNSPALRLRDRVMEDAGGSKSKLSSSYKMMLVFKAFKLYLTSSQIKSLRLRTEGESAEKDIYLL